jgi:hypothetical protein
MSLRIFPVILGLLVSFLGNCLASWLTPTFPSLTLLTAQLLFSFQSHLISILHSSDGYHAHLILDIVSQAIHIPGNFLIITLSMTCFDVQLIEFLCVFFNCHQLLSQVLYPPEQSDLIISWDELCLHLCNHSNF